MVRVARYAWLLCLLAGCEKPAAAISERMLLLDGSSPAAELGRTDAAASVLAASAHESEAALCTATGGVVRTRSCCRSQRGFPEGNGATMACDCSAAESHLVGSCSCGAGRVFWLGRGCALPACDGQSGDQQCNDNPAISSLHGECTPDLTCACKPGFAKNPLSGRCL